MKEKILIIGRPGTGKTNLGNVLSEFMNYGAGTSSLEMDIRLGDADAAVKTLLSLAEYKPSSSDEIVQLNNPGDHTAQYSKFNAVWMIHSPGKQFTVNISRKNLKQMAEAINKSLNK